ERRQGAPVSRVDVCIRRACAGSSVLHPAGGGVTLTSRIMVSGTIAGPTNSMRGAAFLSGLRDAIVVDIGGTTTDIGVLRQGFPRQTGNSVVVGGVRTSFKMPDVYSIALGGGSVVRFGPAGSTDEPILGPDSVGFRISTEATCFGGKTLTATDCAIVLGLAP